MHRSIAAGMVVLRLQKRLAASVLKCGKRKVIIVTFDRTRGIALFGFGVLGQRLDRSTRFVLALAGLGCVVAEVQLKSPA